MLWSAGSHSALATGNPKRRPLCRAAPLNSILVRPVVWIRFARFAMRRPTATTNNLIIIEYWQAPPGCAPHLPMTAKTLSNKRQRGTGDALFALHCLCTVCRRGGGGSAGPLLQPVTASNKRLLGEHCPIDACVQELAELSDW